jgi:hypothetical protein
MEKMQKGVRGLFFVFQFTSTETIDLSYVRHRWVNWFVKVIFS